MTVKKLAFAVSPVALAILVASCGGSGSSSSDNSSVPAQGAANGETDLITESEESSEPEASGSTAGTAITGRVADGYIQGATVCMDLNENDACDAGEPFAVTGAGGVYDLTIPEGAEDSSIVAAIPAEAIDEDTGEAVGQALVFIAPAEQPEFVSPITTLVHQELQSNPNLDIEDAEDAVKALLGVDDETISLFNDYVASGAQSEEASEQSDTYRFIHDTARVVTSLMKEIETQVGDAAGENGTDVVGDADTQNAIRDIVRTEVSELLPDIVRQVAASESADSGDNVEEESAFDPASIASALVPSDITDNVNERITAVIERVEPVLSDIQTVLSEGVYYLEFDCNYNDYTDQGDVDQDGIDQGDTDSGNTDEQSTDGVDEFHEAGSEHCTAFYGRVQLDSSGTQVLSQEFSFDADSGTWFAEVSDSEGFGEFVLVDGDWQALIERGPSGSVEFNDDGTAIITNLQGTTELKAATQNVQTLAVERHLLADDADPFWFELVSDTDIFPSGAQSHIISVDESPNPYVLFNVEPVDADAEFACTEFANNCNVIASSLFDTPAPVSSLDEIRDLATQGIEFSSLFPDLSPTGDVSFILNGEFIEEGELVGVLPDSGTVEWPTLSIEHTGTDNGFTSPTDTGDIGTCYAPELGSEDKEPENAVDIDEEFELTEEELEQEGGVVQQELSPEEQAALEEEFGRVLEELNQAEELAEQEQAELFGQLLQIEEQLAQGEDLATEEREVLEAELARIQEELDQRQQLAQEQQTAFTQEMALLEQALEQEESEFELVDEVQVPDEDTIEFVEAPDAEEFPFPETDACADIAARIVTDKKLLNDDEITTGVNASDSVTTRWKLIEADGVAMIEIQLPDVFLRGNSNEPESMLLIEHEGFVRQGARIPDSYIGTAVTYNEAAFITMQAIAERSSDSR